MRAVRKKSGKKANATSWKPGQSGNPSGMPPLTEAEKEARAILRAATPEAARELIALLRDGEPPMRLRAAESILDRGGVPAVAASAITDTSGNQIDDAANIDALLEYAKANGLAG